MPNHRGLIWSSLLLSVVAGCSSPKVVTFTGRNPDFGSYYTYRIQHPKLPDRQVADSVVSAERSALKRIERAINFHMGARGYDPTAVADLVIQYNLVLEKNITYRIDDSFSRRYSPYPYRYYDPYSRIHRNEYNEGSLLVEIREDSGGKLVWQASLDLKYNQRRASKNRRDPIDNAFNLIFSSFPYQAGKTDPIEVVSEKK